MKQFWLLDNIWRANARCKWNLNTLGLKEFYHSFSILIQEIKVPLLEIALYTVSQA